MFSKTIKTLKKLSIWTKILFIMVTILFITILVNKYKPIQEGFYQREKYILKQNTDIYDSFYASIYGDLFDNSIKNTFEINEISRTTNLGKNSAVLDIGSGLGNHVHSLTKKAKSCVGIDNSISMINAAKQKFNTCDFKHANVLDFMTFQANSFTHITCLYFTIYYIKDKVNVFKNCYDWLSPGGFLILHLVNRDKFDPILDVANPLHIVSLQRYAPKRITSSNVKFTGFDYKADFALDKPRNLAEFNETFKDNKTNHVRANKHTLYMDTQKHILSLAKNVGFILKGKIDLIGCQYEYQYLYIMYKPE